MFAEILVGAAAGIGIHMEEGEVPIPHSRNRRKCRKFHAMLQIAAFSHTHIAIGLTRHADESARPGHRLFHRVPDATESRFDDGPNPALARRLVRKLDRTSSKAA